MFWFEYFHFTLSAAFLGRTPGRVVDNKSAFKFIL